MVSEIGLATDFALIIVAAGAMAFLARQTGQPTIVAYIVTGLVLGPAAFGMVAPGELTETVAELGLAFLLFLLGIKMRIDEIRHIIVPIVKISIPQMTLVALTGAAVALAVGFSLWVSVLIGLAVMYSSTAVVIKMLTDKAEATSLHGKIDVGVLLVQDIVVVILLGVLAAGQPDDPAEIGRTLVTILLLIAVIGFIALAASQYVLPGLFRQVADNKDVFFLVAISWAFLFVFAADELGLSIEMGAFLAGLAIAQLPYSTELQDRIGPLTDVFILIFFVSVGLQLERGDLLAFWQEAVIASLVLIPAKLLIFFVLIDWQDFDLETTFLGSVNMIQVSEFGLVVGTVAVAGGFIDEQVLGFLTLIALFTMSVSVYVIKYNATLFEIARPHISRWGSETEYEPGGKTLRDHAVVIGYDQVSRRAFRRLEEYYGDLVIVDRSLDNVEKLEEEGYDAIYGDFRHGNIRKEAGLKNADFVLSSSVERDVNKALLAEVGQETTVFVEAEWAEDARELYRLGAHYVVMSTQLTAERLAEYFETYFEDRERFDEQVEAELRHLERTGRFGRDPGPGGDDDD